MEVLGEQRSRAEGTCKGSVVTGAGQQQSRNGRGGVVGQRASGRAEERRGWAAASPGEASGAVVRIVVFILEQREILTSFQ